MKIFILFNFFMLYKSQFPLLTIVPQYENNILPNHFTFAYFKETKNQPELPCIIHGLWPGNDDNTLTSFCRVRNDNQMYQTGANGISDLITNNIIAFFQTFLDNRITLQRIQQIQHLPNNLFDNYQLDFINQLNQPDGGISSLNILLNGLDRHFNPIHEYLKHGTCMTFTFDDIPDNDIRYQVLSFQSLQNLIDIQQFRTIIMGNGQHAEEELRIFWFHFVQNHIYQQLTRILDAKNKFRTANTHCTNKDYVNEDQITYSLRGGLNYVFNHVLII